MKFKNVEILIKVLQKLQWKYSDVKLLLVGTGDSDYIDYLKDLAVAIEISKGK